MKHLLLLATLALLGAWGCAPTNESPLSSFEEPMTTPHVPANYATMVRLGKTPASSMSFRSVSLCKLLNLYHDAAGEFVVEDIRSAVEMSDVYHSPQPFTYAVLSSEREWNSGTAARMVLRMPGGALGDGTVLSTDVGLTVGQTFTAFLRRLPSENQGFYQILGLTVFEGPQDALSNGQLFRLTKMSQNGLEGLYRSNTTPTFQCRQDAQPERNRPEAGPTSVPPRWPTHTP